MEFSRQNFFIENAAQKKLEEIKILVAGVGLGSIIAECLIRMGIANLTIVDGDVVEESNLNRQNYVYKNIGKNKSKCLKQRLHAINPNAKIKYFPKFLNKKNIKSFIEQADIVINTIDFDHPAFFLCNYFTKKLNKIEIFPMNLAFGNCILVSNKTAPDFTTFFKKQDLTIKDDILEFIFSKMPNYEKFSFYIKKYNVKKQELNYKDPQLGVGSFLNAAIVATIIAKIVKNDEIKIFPEIYQIDLEFDL